MTDDIWLNKKIWANGCNETVPQALRYLADHGEVPRGGEHPFNSIHLEQLADEIDRAVEESKKQLKESYDRGHSFAVECDRLLAKLKEKIKPITRPLTWQEGWLCEEKEIPIWRGVDRHGKVRAIVNFDGSIEKHADVNPAILQLQKDQAEEIYRQYILSLLESLT